MWYTWPPGRKIVTHVGCRQLLLTKGTPIYLVGPFIEGAKVPSNRGRGNLSREALDQPITHHWRLDPSSSLGVHYCRAVVLYHNRGTNKTANQFEQNFVVNFSFCLILLGVKCKKKEKDDQSPLTVLPPPEQCIYGLFGPRPGKCKEHARKHIHRRKKVLKNDS